MQYGKTYFHFRQQIIHPYQVSEKLSVYLSICLSVCLSIFINDNFVQNFVFMKWSNTFMRLINPIWTNNNKKNNDKKTKGHRTEHQHQNRTSTITIFINFSHQYKIYQNQFFLCIPGSLKRFLVFNTARYIVYKCSVRKLS